MKFVALHAVMETKWPASAIDHPDHANALHLQLRGMPNAMHNLSAAVAIW